MKQVDFENLLVFDGPLPLSRVQARRVVQLLGAAIRAHLSQGEDVLIPEVGRLTVMDIPARQRRNPRTGETFTAPATRRVKFKPGKLLREGLAVVGE